LLAYLPEIGNNKVEHDARRDLQGDQAEEQREDLPHHLGLGVLGRRRRPGRHLALLVVAGHHRQGDEDVERHGLATLGRVRALGEAPSSWCWAVTVPPSTLMLVNVGLFSVALEPTPPTTMAPTITVPVRSWIRR